MKRVWVDFNSTPLYTTDRGGKLKVGEKVIAYTTDNETPFGFEATVTEIQTSQNPNVWIDIYYLDCDYEGHRYEGTELGLDS